MEPFGTWRRRLTVPRPAGAARIRSLLQVRACLRSTVRNDSLSEVRTQRLSAVKTQRLSGLALACALVTSLAGWVTPARADSVQGVPTAGSVSSRHSVKVRRVQAFLLASSPDSVADLRLHYRRIGVLYPTYFECQLTSGQITGADDPGVTDFARSKHLTVMPRFNCQDGATVHRILTDPQTRAQTLTGLGRLAVDASYQGLNLDLENDVASDREALTSFVAALVDELHAEGKKLAVDVEGVTHEDTKIGSGFYDDIALGAEADTIFVMAWGTHWEGSAPGPIAPLPFVRSVAAYVAALPNARRFVLGTPMYGLDWPAGGGRASAYQFTGVRTLAGVRRARPIREASADEDTFEYDSEGVAHRVWYLDARAIADRLRIGRESGLAIGVWRLGSEDQALWSSSAVTG
jgi:spore germination protein YaaH